MSIQKNYAVTVDLSQDGQGISIASTSVSSQQIVGTGFLTGPQGESAYQAWLDQGNVGTEADFIDSLKGDPGTDGTDGTNGTNGQGVPTGGTANQALTKVDGDDYNTQWVTLNKSSVGLGNVDNTSDLNKPVSTATQAMLDMKPSYAELADVAFTGNKADVGLGNVNDTSDANKPVSTAQQAALDLKANDNAVLHTTGNESATGTKTFANVIVAASTGDALLINGTGSANSLLRYQDDGTERGALFSLNGNSEFVLRSQARLALISNNSGTPKYIYSDLGSLYSTSGMDLGSNSNMWVNGYVTTLNSTSINTTNLRVGTSTTSGYVLTADSSGNATWQAATGGGGGMSNPMTTAGDIIVGGTSGAPTRLAASATANRVLRVGTAGSTPAYGQVALTTDVTGSLPVANGGTGRATSTTAYGLIAAGTTATGAQQTISPGTSGQFLKSAGGSALAAFANIALSDLSDASTVVTLSGIQTLIGKTLTGGLVTADPSTALGIASKQYVDSKSNTYTHYANHTAHAGAVIPNVYTTYQTVTATTTGGKVIFTGIGFLKDGNSGAVRTGHMRIQIDGVTVTDSDQIWNTVANGQYINVALLAQSTPSSGSHTFTLQISADTASATTINSSMFEVREVR